MRLLLTDKFSTVHFYWPSSIFVSVKIYVPMSLSPIYALPPLVAYVKKNVNTKLCLLSLFCLKLHREAFNFLKENQ